MILREEVDRFEDDKLSVVGMMDRVGAGALPSVRVHLWRFRLIRAR